MSAYTEGPWRDLGSRQIGTAAGVVCEVWSSVGESDAERIEQADENVRRIVACVNACEGIGTDALIVPRSIQSRIESACGELYETKRDINVLIDQMRRINDAACYATEKDPLSWYQALLMIGSIARAAIHDATGEIT